MGGKLLVYTDGAARGNPGPAGAAAVLCGEDGEPVEETARHLGRATNNVAEYEGLLMGLRRARERGAEEVVVFTDSELLARQLQGRYRVRHPALRPLFERARALMGEFRRVEVRHIARGENARADAAANRAIDVGPPKLGRVKVGPPKEGGRREARAGQAVAGRTLRPEESPGSGEQGGP